MFIVTSNIVKAFPCKRQTWKTSQLIPQNTSTKLSACPAHSESTGWQRKHWCPSARVLLPVIWPWQITYSAGQFPHLQTEGWGCSPGFFQLTCFIILKITSNTVRVLKQFAECHTELTPAQADWFQSYAHPGHTALLKSLSRETQKPSNVPRPSPHVWKRFLALLLHLLSLSKEAKDVLKSLKFGQHEK